MGPIEVDERVGDTQRVAVCFDKIAAFDVGLHPEGVDDGLRGWLFGGGFVKALVLCSPAAENGWVRIRGGVGCHRDLRFRLWRYSVFWFPNLYVLSQVPRSVV